MRISDWSSDVCSSDLEAVHRVVSGLQIFQEIEVTVAIIEDGEIDEALAIVLHQQLIGIFGRRYARRRGARGNALVHLGFVVEVGVHFELDRPAERDDFQEIDDVAFGPDIFLGNRSEEHTSELQSLMRISYAVFCLKKK